MELAKFEEDTLKFFLPESFKSLSKQYILYCIFNKEIQTNWKPKVGDIIVGSTGNVFVISAKHHLIEKLGGDLFLFGGVLCSRNGGNFMNETTCSTLNRTGILYDIDQKSIENSYNHNTYLNYRYVPYPHEL